MMRKRVFALVLSLQLIFGMTYHANAVDKKNLASSQNLTANVLNTSTTKATTNEPYVSYDFKNNLTDSCSHSKLTVLGTSGNPSNSKTGYGKDASGPYWYWESNAARGGGFYIYIDKNIGENYTIGLKFSFSNTMNGWRKIIDYKNSTKDTGFYFYNNGHLNFFNYGVNGNSVTNSNQVVNMIVQRSSKDNTFKAYIVGDDGVPVLDLNVTDSSGQGIPYYDQNGTKLGFFYDDNATSSEATPSGKIYMLKVWDEVIDVTKVNEELDKAIPGVNVKYVTEEGKELTTYVKLEGEVG